MSATLLDHPAAAAAPRAPEAGFPVLAFEMTWRGRVHAPGNASTLQTVAAALPGHAIHLFAEPGHIAEVRGNAAIAGNRAMRFHPVRLSDQYQGRPHLVSFRRFFREALTIWRALDRVPRGAPCLILLLSATSTAIFAAAWISWLRGRGHAAIHVGLHGNLNDAGGWRPRNPLRRAFDLDAAFGRAFGGRVRYLVLEDAIRDALRIRRPALVPRVDVLPLPINIAEFDAAIAAPDADGPVRVGLVGHATKAKGIEPFLRIAGTLKARHGDAVSFHLVGCAMPGTDKGIFAPLAEMPDTAEMPRDAFVRRLGRLHYVMLPLSPEYYDLAASGALIDAVTWLKPILALPVGCTKALFAAAGDVGALCADEAELRETLSALIADPDPARYARQVQALRRVRESRLPAPLAAAYRDLLETHFPVLARDVSPASMPEAGMKRAA